MKGITRTKAKGIVITPWFLPKDHRRLRPGEVVRQTDWYWSSQNKTWFPVKRWYQLAGKTLPYIRRIGE